MKNKELSVIRRENLEQILNILRTGPKTRQEMKEAAGISLMSITNITNQLLANGIIDLTDGEKETKSRGRRAELVALKTEHPVWMVLDLRNYDLELVLFNYVRETVYNQKFTASGSYINDLTKFLQTARQLFVQHGIREISVITPGPYNPSADRVINMRIPELNHLSLKQLIKEQINTDCFIEEDVKLSVAALCEQLHSSALYYLYIGQGVGGAFANGGQLLRGLNSMAGDPGQLTCGDTVFEELLNEKAFYQEAAKKSAAEVIREKALVTAELLKIVIWMMDPHSIVIDCSYILTETELYKTIIQQQLNNSIRQQPEIIVNTQTTNQAYIGAVKAAEHMALNRICSGT